MNKSANNLLDGFTQSAALLLSSLLLTGGCCSVFHIFCPSVDPSSPPPQESVLPPIEPSEIDLPITYSLQDAFAQAENAIPLRHDAWDAWTFTEVDGVWAYEYSFWRDPLGLALNGNSLSLSLHGYYKARGGRRVGGHVVTLGSCGDGEPPREITAGIATTFSFSPTWKLESKTALVGAINYPNQCDVTLLNFNVTHYIQDAVNPQIGSIPSAIDAKVSQYDIRPAAQTVWSDIQQPVKISESAWLLLSPELVRLGSLNGSGSSLNISVGMQAHPKIFIGNKPSPTTNPFPNLQSSLPASGFHIALEGQLSLDDASSALRKQLVSRRYPFGNRYVTITDARVYGNGNQMVVQLGINGTVKGTLYFTGTPVFTSATGSTPDVITVPDLDFSISTKNVLAKVANWLNHEGFRQSIAAEAKWPLTASVNEAKTQLQSALNQPIGTRAVLTGSLKALRPIGFYSTPTMLIARVCADGTAILSIK
jgi:hypothetical protein